MGKKLDAKTAKALGYFKHKGSIYGPSIGCDWEDRLEDYPQLSDDASLPLLLADMAEKKWLWEMEVDEYGYFNTRINGYEHRGFKNLAHCICENICLMVEYHEKKEKND